MVVECCSSILDPKKFVRVLLVEIPHYLSPKQNLFQSE